MGLDMGAMMPCLTMTRGFVPCWNVSFVTKSLPTGRRRVASYCSLDSKEWGSWEARYLSF